MPRPGFAETFVCAPHCLAGKEENFDPRSSAWRIELSPALFRSLALQLLDQTMLLLETSMVMVIWMLPLRLVTRLTFILEGTTGHSNKGEAWLCGKVPSQLP